MIKQIKPTTSGQAIGDALCLHNETGGEYIVTEKNGKYQIYIDSEFSRELIKKNVEKIIYSTINPQLCG
jgi:hypothetical protein